MALQKKDFIEIEFTGRLKDTGEIFDSNVKEELEKIHNGHDHPIEAKPFVYCLGEGMFLAGVDDYLIGKEIGKHTFGLSPEKAFGKRSQKLVKMIPIKIFFEHKINPIQGAVLNFDGKMGKVLSVSGGRVLIDFNHPLSGKDITYEINVRKIIQNIDDKIKAFNDFIFRKEIKFSVSQKDKKTIYKIPESEKQLKLFVQMFKEKFKEIFSMDLELEEEQKTGSFLTNLPSGKSQIKEEKPKSEKQEDKEKK